MLLLALVLIPAVVVVVALVIAVVVGRRMANRMYAGTGLDEWRRIAAALPWRDRWELYRANARGRAAAPELAARAVQRGEVLVACSGRATRSSRLHKLWLVLGVASLVLCMANIALLVAGERGWNIWLQIVTQGTLAFLWLGMPALQQRQMTKVTRSVRLNRELVARQEGGAG